MDDIPIQKFDAVRRILTLVLSLAGSFGIALIIYGLYRQYYDPFLACLVVENIRLLIGLPFACIAAFVIVALFRQGEGVIEIEGLGFKFRGAAGEIVLWNITFGIIVAGMWLLWSPPEKAVEAICNLPSPY